MSRFPLSVLALSALLTLLAPACSHVVGASVVGSGKKTSATRTVPSFTEVRATGAFRLEVQSGAPATSVVVEGDDNPVPLFETNVSSGALELHLPSGSFSPKQPLVVHVAAPSVTKVGAIGAVTTEVAAISGSEFEARLSGACRLRLRGAVDAVHCVGDGACEIEAFDLEAGEVELSLSGSSLADVQATRRLEVSSSGASTVRYRGKPEVKTSISGSSKVTPDEGR